MCYPPSCCFGALSFKQFRHRLSPRLARGSAPGRASSCSRETRLIATTSAVMSSSLLTASTTARCTVRSADLSRARNAKTSRISDLAHRRHWKCCSNSRSSVAGRNVPHAGVSWRGAEDVITRCKCEAYDADYGKSADSQAGVGAARSSAMAAERFSRPAIAPSRSWRMTMKSHMAGTRTTKTCLVRKTTRPKTSFTRRPRICTSPSSTTPSAMSGVVKPLSRVNCASGHTRTGFASVATAATAVSAFALDAGGS